MTVTKIREGRGKIIARPNPIPIGDYSLAGSTTLSWSCDDVEEVEVRVSAPDGPLLSRTGPAGTAVTGVWVTNEMTFYLQDVSSGKELTPNNTLDAITTYLTPVPFAATLPCFPASDASKQPVEGAGRPRVLVAGWFSFENGGATAGDLLSRDLICRWLEEACQIYDVANSKQFEGGVDWRGTDASDYSRVVFVCGPFAKGPMVQEFLEHFARSALFGVNLSLSTPVAEWNPFDALLERDSSVQVRHDISFLSGEPREPVIGVVLLEPGTVSTHRPNEAIRRLLAQRGAAIVEIDTRLPVNAGGLRTPGEIESLIARMDVVVTTRLHGMVLAIKNGVPAVVIDPTGGEGKVFRQARALGWPFVFKADELDDEKLRQALQACLGPDARQAAAQCAALAQESLAGLRGEFTTMLERLASNRS